MYTLHYLYSEFIFGWLLSDIFYEMKVKMAAIKLSYNLAYLNRYLFRTSMWCLEAILRDREIKIGNINIKSSIKQLNLLFNYLRKDIETACGTFSWIVISELCVDLLLLKFLDLMSFSFLYLTFNVFYYVENILYNWCLFPTFCNY